MIGPPFARTRPIRWKGVSAVFLIAEVEIPQKKDPAAFAKFVREKWVPKVHMGPTRAGQVQEVKVLQRIGGTVPFDPEEPHQAGNRFLVLAEWDGFAPQSAGGWFHSETLADNFKRFGAKVEESAGWQEVASRP